MGAPHGNQNAVKAKRWNQAIDRALAKRSKGDAIAALDELAEKFLNAVEKGDKDMIPGFAQLGDRLDGKPRQQIEAVDDEGRTLAIGLIAYKPADNNPAPLPAEAISTPRTTGD